MADTASLKISVDSRDVKNTKTDLDNLSNASGKTEQSVNKLSTSMKVGLVTVSVAAAAALKKVSDSGFEFNKSIEQAINGLTALTVATSSNISSTGRLLTQQEKYNLAQKEAISTAMALQKINAETPHTLNQTNQIYKAMYVSMKAANVTNEQMIDLTKKISIAAGAAGIEFNSLLAGVDGLASGTVIASSDLGRFLNSLGLTNAKLKESDDIFGLVNSKLKDFKAVDDYATALSNLENSYDQLAGTLTEDIFEVAKSGFKALTEQLVFLNIELKDYKQNINDFRDVNKLTNIEDLERELKQLTDAYTKSVNSGVGFFDSQENYNANLIKQEFLINKTIKKIEQLKNAQTTEQEVLIKTKAEPSDEEIKELEKKEKEKAKRSHEIAQSQLKMIQEESDKKIALEEDYQNTVFDLAQKSNEDKLDGLAKESLVTFNYYDSLILKYAEVAGAEATLRELQAEAMDVIIEKQNELNEAYDNKSAIDSLDEIYGRYEKLIDAQIELAENGMNIDFDFGDGAKELNNISKAIQQLHVGSLKYVKQDIKLQEDYAKAYLKAGNDTLKQAQLEADFDADSAKLTEARQAAEINGYAALAGAMSSAFSEGSASAQAFQAIQATLGIVNGLTAISGAWASAPFPANLPAVALTTAQMLPLIASLGSLGGSSGIGGGGVSSISSTGQTYEQNREKIDAEYTPITDRLDRQIELLERLNLQGSASLAGITRADVGFERDYKLFLEDTFAAVRKSFDLRVIERQGFSADSFVAEMERIDDLINGELFTSQNVAAAAKMSDAAKGFLNEDVLREGDNMLIFLAEASKSIYGQMALVDDIHKNWGENIKETETYFANTLNEIFDITAEYANNMLDVMDELKDASETMKDSYDNLTGTMFYETSRLVQAFSEFDAIRGESSYADYLQEQITAIDELNTMLNGGLVDLLLSEDPTRIAEQVEAIEALGEASGRVFAGGAEEALNYLESIELVAEAMARSRENIESFVDSLKTSDQLASDMASTIGVGLATSIDGLASLFYKLSEDMDGLTDADLNLLNANKALLENTDEYQTQIDGLNIALDDASKAITTLDGALGTIQSTIEKLRAASRTSEQSLQIYYDAIAEAQRLSTTTLYEDYAKAVSKASTATSALFDIDNFELTRDMEFAQQKAALEFEALADITMTEVDYLKQIELNTRTQIDVLTEAMNNLGVSVSSSLSSAINKIGESKVSPSNTASYIKDIYTKYDLNQYQTDSSGFAYWEQQVASGAIAVQNLDAAIRASAEEILGVSLPSFAVGTPNVPYDMLAQIHKGEIVTPATYSEGIRNGDIMMGDTSGMIRELQTNNNLLSGIISKQDKTISILLESRDIQNGSVEILERVEAII